jgi:ribonuclease P/MRP protein subunit RPP40
MGVNGQLLGHLSNYLSGRTQRAVINEIKSDQQPVRAGVPQGSILGPLLFLVYINDLPDQVASNISLFADDTTLWAPADNLVNANEILNEDLSKFSQWANKWHMSLNAGKSEVLTVGCRRQPSDYFELMIDGTFLKQVVSYKHLGLTISSNMTWSDHIDNVCAAAGSRLNILYRGIGPDYLSDLYTQYVPSNDPRYSMRRRLNLKIRI